MVDETEEWRQTHPLDDTVEPASGVAEPLLARREPAEVGRRDGDLGVVQLEDDAAGQLSADFDVELRLVRSGTSGSEKSGVRRRWVFCEYETGSEYGKGRKGRSSLGHGGVK
jgi:hypothetical protein